MFKSSPFKNLVWCFSTFTAAIAAHAQTPDHAACERVADFRDNSEPTKWIAVCSEVADENVGGSARNDLDDGYLCIAEKQTVNDRSAIGPYQDPVGTSYYSTFGVFNKTLVRTQTADLTSYQGNPSSDTFYPKSTSECMRMVGKPFWGRPLTGACDLGDRLFIHGSFFQADYYMDYDKRKKSLTFEKVNHELGFFFTKRHTSIKAVLRCESL